MATASTIVRTASASDPVDDARNKPIDTVVEVETPEHIEFSHRIAGPTRRAMAYLIDLFICVLIFVLIIVIVALASYSGRQIVEEVAGYGVGVVLLAAFALEWGYFTLSEAFTGRTIGKRILGMRVLTVHGRPIGFGAALLRNLLRAADAMPYAYVVLAPYVVGLLSMTVSRKFQRLGDLVAGTIVVTSAPRSTLGASYTLSPPARPDELALLPDSVVLDAEERAALELFLRRRAALGYAREHELAAMIAEPLAKRLGARHPDPARLLALLYDRAVTAGRVDPPVSSRQGAAGARA